MKSNPNRRAFLRGMGACLSLPAMESFGAPDTALGKPGVPPRLAYLYFPNGSAEGSWEPEKVGPAGELQKLNRWMAPLEEFKKDLVVTKNLWTPRGNGHGAGTATWLTGGSYDHRKNDVGAPSVDQLVAKHLSDSTPLPSLELSTAGEGSFSGSLPR
ncbi:DUF1552 domain-containing protein, partial [Akkermansiaceae bacterium]|nr:DUF1552 domain-containing protein [Akkermansiaceae bacterium]